MKSAPEGQECEDWAAIVVEAAADDSGDFWPRYFASVLEADQVRSTLGPSSVAEVEAWRRQGKLLLVASRRGPLFPAFPFADGSVEPSIARALSVLPRSENETGAMNRAPSRRHPSDWLQTNAQP